MTAEIAILNSFGVALAADSAVTINTGNGERKIYNTANKVFMLSKFHPVGIMIYSNAKIMGIDWELVIKLYREQLGKKEFTQLKDYADDFFNYIEANEVLFSKEQEKFYLSFVITTHLIAIRSKIIEKFKEVVPVESADVPKVVEEIISDHMKSWEEKKDLPNKKMTYDDFKLALKTYKIDLEMFIKKELEKLPISLSAKGKIKETIYLSIKKNSFLKSYSGIVFAGYGKENIFPAIEAYSIEGMFNRQLKYASDKSVKVDVNHNAAIIPFAQFEMVGSFMEGIDPYYQNFIEKQIHTAMQKLESLIEKADDKLKIPEIEKEFFETLKEYRKKGCINPIISIVGSLPKDELAAMAESLVNLTSFKRKVSAESETVGGPIDVALISKCDGFIWVKRKHYFKPELNNHFFRNYYRGVENE
ncbi:MAG TPA: hypothetical protein PLZ43_13810 [bacterium]|nr:hypothetical protein [bacterium]